MTLSLNNVWEVNIGQGSPFNSAYTYYVDKMSAQTLVDYSTQALILLIEVCTF